MKRTSEENIEGHEDKKPKEDFEVVEEDDFAVEVRFTGPADGLEVAYLDVCDLWGFGDFKLLSEDGDKISIPKNITNTRLYCPGKSCRNRGPTPTYMKNQGNYRVDDKVIGRRFQHRQAKAVEFDASCSFPAVCVLLNDGSIRWKLAGESNSKWSLPSHQAQFEGESHESIFKRVYGSKMILL